MAVSATATYNEGDITRSTARILVTGGAGFIGSHLVSRLMEQGHDVIVMDNLFSGSKKNLAKWWKHPNFEFVRHDVTEPFLCEVDQIYHLACPASPVFYQHNAIKTFKTSILGTMNMLGLAKRTGARILLASTSEVYGDPACETQDEEYWGNVNCTGIRSCYDEGKRGAETLMFDYWRQHQVDIRVARIFNTYGPQMLTNDGRVVSNFVVQALKDQKLTVYGDGSQTRSFCFVADCVEGLMRLMNGEHVGPINIGNPDQYTIKDFAVNILRTIRPGVDPEEWLVYRPLPSDDPKRRKPNIDRAKRLLKWEPTVSLADGIAATVADFSARLGVAPHEQPAGDVAPEAAGREAAPSAT